MRYLFLVLLFIIQGDLLAQSISRQVISSTGHLNNGQISSSTVGPSILFTSSLSDTVQLTQGFQQPTADMLLVEVLVTDPTCFDFNGGAIEVIPTGCTGNYTITWSTGSEEALIEDLSTGTYSVEIQSGTCSFFQEIVLEISSDCESTVPNLLTPNGDGSNDTWVIPELYSSTTDQNQVKIFNRWGQLVWENQFYNNTDNIWDGTNVDGNELPTGTYYYELMISTELKTGYIELLR